MADLSNPLDQVAVGQAQPAVTVNELIDALSPAAVFGRRNRACSGLVWGYYGGRHFGNAIAHGTLTVAAAATSYIVVHRATGVVSHSTSTTNWNDTGVYDRLYLVVSNATDIIDWDDYRQIASSTIDTEAIQDIVGALLVAGSGVTIVYDDPSNTLTISATGGGGSLTSEQVEDIVGALVVGGDHIAVDYNDAESPPSLVIRNTRPGMAQEEVEDLIASFIQAGAGVSIQYNDGDSPASLVISAPGDPEFIQDTIAALLVAGNGISITYDDAGSPPTIVIESTQQQLTQENIEDIVANLITVGSGMTKVYNDADSPASLHLDATGGGGSGAAEFFISETDPAGSPSPANGARWLKLSTGIEYTWVQGTWVQLD